jgi:four helix bundle protein
MDSHRPHEKLEVWKRAIELSVDIYRLTEGLPAAEKYGLTSQMRRAAVSVSSNIAEGAGRGSTGYYMHHLSIAQGSLSELETQLVISNRLGFIDDEKFTAIKEQTMIIGKMISSLIRSLRAKGVKEDPIPYSPVGPPCPIPHSPFPIP